MFQEKLLAYLHSIFEHTGKTCPDLDDTEDQEGLRTLYTKTLTDVFHQAKWRWISKQTEESRLELFSASADLLAYACLIDEKMGGTTTVEDTFILLRGPSSQIDKRQAQAAALAKYGLQASLLTQENASFDHIVIAAAVHALPEYNPNWGGRRINQAGRPRKEKND